MIKSTSNIHKCTSDTMSTQSSTHFLRLTHKLPWIYVKRLRFYYFFRCVLQDVPYFQHLNRLQTTPGERPTQLRIEDNSTSIQSILRALEYVYKDYCFTSQRNPAQFHCFCQFVEKPSLAVDSFTQAMQCLNQSNCIDYFRLGKAYQLIPLERRAWRKAVEHRWMPQIQEMMTERIDLSAPLTAQKETPLHLSISRGDTDLVRVLINAGASVNVTDYMGTSPLGLAVWTEHIELSQLLLQSGADVNSVDQWRQTALHKACGKGLNDMVQLLLDHGAETNLSSRDGYTPLHLAAIGGK